MSVNLDLLNSMRGEGLLTDVILVSEEGQEIKAHKNILAASSPYFYTMFTGGNYNFWYIFGTHLGFHLGHIWGHIWDTFGTPFGHIWDTFGTLFCDFW